jgi:hypothetical protein
LVIATQKVEELHARLIGQSTSFAQLESALCARVCELEGQLTGERAKAVEERAAIVKREEALREREKTMQDAVAKIKKAPNEVNSDLVVKLQEVSTG